MGWPLQTRARVVAFLIGLAAGGGALLAILCLFAASPEAGGTVTCSDNYIGATNGSWNTAANWSTGVVPGRFDTACINTGAGTISFSGTTSSITGVTVASGDTLAVTSGTLAIEGPSFTSSIASLSIAGGTFVADNPASITTLSVSSGSFNGYGSSTASTLSWTGGYFGNGNAGDGQLTVSGATTINTQTSQGVYQFSLVLDGAAAVQASGGSPGFFLGGQSSLILADTSSPPTIAEGATVSASGGFVQVDPGVTLTVTGTSGATTTVGNLADEGIVSVPSNGTLLVDGGTSPGVFDVTGSGILELSGAELTGSGTDVSGTSSTLEVYDSTIDGTVDVSEVTGFNSSSVSYFYGTVTAATIETGPAAGSPEQTLYFGGPSVSATTALDLYGGGVSGSAPISAASFTWSGGSIGIYDSAATTGTITVSGTATITTPSGSNSYMTSTSLVLDGATSIGTATMTNPSFSVSNAASLILADTSSPPTIVAGATISGSGLLQINPGVTFDAPSGTWTVNCNVANRGGTFEIPAGASVVATTDGIMQLGGATNVSPGATLQVGSGGTNGLVLLGGTLDGTGTVSGGVTAKGGTVQGGSGGASGTLTISGNLTVSNGATLHATLGGTSAGSNYSQVVASTATLAGTLSTSLASGYTPAAGDTYSVLVTTSTPSGTFGQLTPPLLGTVAYSVSYAATGVDIVIPSVAIAARVTESSKTSRPGQSVTFVISLRNVRAARHGARAWVSLYAGTHRIGRGLLRFHHGRAELSTRSLPLGTHTITARVFEIRGKRVLGAVARTVHRVALAVAALAVAAPPQSHPWPRPTASSSSSASGPAKSGK